MFIIPALTKLLYFRIFEFYLHFGSCCGKTINRTYDFIRQLTERIMAKHVDLNDIHVQIYKRYNKINTYKIRNFSLIFFSTIKSLLPSLCTSWGTLMHKSLLSKILQIFFQLTWVSNIKPDRLNLEICSHQQVEVTYHCTS